MADLGPTIATTAASPKSMTTDAGSATAQSLADQIAADKYLAAKAAMTSGGRGVLFNKFIKGNQIGSVSPGGET